jgi:LDH2 family malate/lactate/ureidoglycolate dehydrogenase
MDTVTVPPDVLRDFARRILVAMGCDGANAHLIAEGLVEADLRGNRIQGTDHLYSVISALQAGRINGAARPRVVRESAATALVDGDGGAGHVGGRFAADLAVDKAKATGIGAVGLARAGDTFMLAGYVDRMASADLVGMAFTNSLYSGGNPYFVCVHPAGGIDPVLGTNPLAIEFPTRDGGQIVADLATSTSAMGHLRLASYRGGQIPAGVAIDHDGYPTTDPFAAMAGALTPLGGHKGFALGLAVALLSGPMVGADIGAPLKAQAQSDDPPNLGHFFLAIDPAAFGPLEAYHDRVDAFVAELKAGRRAPGVEAIHMPGERSLRRREQSLADGISLLAETWQQLVEYAHEAGVPAPDLD